MIATKITGKPHAGKPHVRIEGGRRELYITLLSTLLAALFDGGMISENHIPVVFDKSRMPLQKLASNPATEANAIEKVNYLHIVTQNSNETHLISYEETFMHTRNVNYTAVLLQGVKSAGN